MVRSLDPEIDFENGCVSVTPYYKEVGKIAEQLRAVRNPYTGNKRKLLEGIFVALRERDIQFDSLLDLFSGSGMVGLAAKRLGEEGRVERLTSASLP